MFQNLTLEPAEPVDEGPSDYDGITDEQWTEYARLGWLDPIDGCTNATDSQDHSTTESGGEQART